MERREIQRLEMPPFAKVVNRIEVIFDGVAPVVASGEGDADSRRRQ
ncbi:MAG: hypothetical protein R3A44_32120 [Caldilineaceae bacterium]